MLKKQYEKDFEFVLTDKQKQHLINKSNEINSSGAEYIRLLIEQDILSEELIKLQNKSLDTLDKLKAVKDKLNRFHNKSDNGW